MFLSRLREFTQAEIEYFVHPDRKTHSGYSQVKHMVVNLFTQDLQQSHQAPIQISIDQSLNSGFICHELMAFFIGSIAKLAEICGIRVYRFRQHLSTEKAHYSSECWDLECLIDENWLECVGISDRGCYDCTAHKITAKDPMIVKSNKVIWDEKLLFNKKHKLGWI